MNIVENVEIEGFWGDKTVNIPFKEDTNFLIGVNGSGKTTAINLLAAALQADFATLDRLQFKAITVTLKEVGGRRKPSIRVTKKSTARTSFYSVVYEIRDTATAPPKKYSLDEHENQRLLRTVYSVGRHLPARELHRRLTKGVIEHLHQLINVNWLSIHRSTFNRMYAEDDESYESTIDKKLKDLGDDMVRFFSTIERMKNELLGQFQKRVFLSLIELPKEEVIDDSINADDLRKGLIGIYEQFKVDTPATRNRLDQYFLSLQQGIRLSERDKRSDAQGPALRSLVAAITAPRVSTVVGDWWALQKQQADVESSKNRFLDLINDMLLGKKLVINEKNELLAVTEGGYSLTARQLSSGEKQLLIILGDALLQQGKPHTYIADEPELSLHVDWQERLITTLRAINPEAQVIVATHSPDIVGVYKDRTMNMADLIS